MLKNSLLVVCLSVTVGACGSSDTELAPLPRTRHWIVAVDLSGSRNPVELGEAQRFVRGLQAVVNNGDNVTLLRLYERGLADSSFMWQTEIPKRRDARRMKASDSLALADFGEDLEVATDLLFNPKILGRLQGTDIFSTLQRVHNLIQASGTEDVSLVLVSDMLHSTRALDMERTLPSASWVREASARGEIPDLLSACVIVMGAEENTTRAAAVRTFWTEYFTAAKASLAQRDYRHFAPSPWVCESQKI